MSSDKRRLKLRLRRLQETFQALGKDPNAKGNYSRKCLTNDRIRGQIADTRLRQDREETDSASEEGQALEDADTPGDIADIWAEVT
jgi:hypothetical protein